MANKGQSVRFSVRGKPVSRVAAYLKALMRAAIVLSVLAGALALVQEIWHPFDRALKTADAKLAAVDRALDSDLVAGISLGAVVVVAVVAVFSVAGRGVARKQYFVSFWRGLVSSAIFLVSDVFYRYVKDQGRLYYIASIALFVAATLVLVELLSRWGKLAEERERRTEFLASIVSGLCFALIVQALDGAWGWAKHFLGPLLG